MLVKEVLSSFETVPNVILAYSDYAKVTSGMTHNDHQKVLKTFTTPGCSSETLVPSRFSEVLL